MKFIKLMALLALAGVVVASLSSDQVLDLVGGSHGYLNQGESAKLLLPTPLEVQGERYWIAYFYQTTSPDTKNLYIAVNDNTGDVERDGGKLALVFGVTGKLAVLDSLKAAKASLDDISLFLSDAQKQREAAEQLFSTAVKQQIELKHPELSFDEIETALNDLRDKESVMADGIRETRDLKSQFELYGTALDFDNYFTSYNASFGKANVVARSAAKYQSAVLAKANEVTNSQSLNFSEKQDIKATLEKLYDIGDFAGFKSTVSDPAIRAVDSQLKRSDAFVNNSVDSTLYRVTRKDAERAYSDELKAAVTSLLSPARESDLRACNVDVTGLRASWAELRSTMENPANATAASYKTVPQKAGEVQALVAAATKKLNDCLTAPAPVVKQPKQDNTLSNALIGLLVIVLAYVGYTRYKKWREESE